MKPRLAKGCPLKACFATFLLLCLLGGCAALPKAQRQQAADYAASVRSQAEACEPGNPCDLASPLRELGEQAYAASTDEAPRHRLVLLDRGQDALLARLHLIRSARRSIELQTFIFERDDSGGLVLDALMDAARRGVKVRILLDQLYGLSDPALQARLAGFHRNFQLRLYNPTFDEARTQQLEFVAGILFSFRRFNQRMHTKLLLVDGRVAVVGGRNLQDRYFDWGQSYNYRDRDLLVAGPATTAMAGNFEEFWRSPRSHPAESLGDVAERLQQQRLASPSVSPPLPPHPRSPRAQAMWALAGDGAACLERFRPWLLEVGRVDFYADLPDKHDAEAQSRSAASQAMRDLIAGSQRELVIQTPYLVLSREARRAFRALQRRPQPPQVLVSTNSLAATDAFPVYAMSHKYKRLYLRELGFEIHEFKPFPLSSPIDLAATGALGPDRPPQALGASTVPMGSTGSGGGRRGPVPLKSAGVRVGLHAKSMVVDGRVGVVGSHNFDPRSDAYNTESLVVVHDPTFAQALAASIRADMRPENAWVIGPRPKLPVLWGLNYNLGKLSEKLPVFDIWPLPYATSYELQPDCQPVSYRHPDFARCHRDVGDFPEVDLGLKGIYTRILTAFGAGLVPIL